MVGGEMVGGEMVGGIFEMIAFLPDGDSLFEAPKKPAKMAISLARIKQETAGTAVRDVEGATPMEEPRNPANVQLLNVLMALNNLSQSIASATSSDDGADSVRGGCSAGGASPSTGAEEDAEEDADASIDDPMKDVDQDAVAQFTCMGFSPTAAAKALVLNGGRVEAAMEWLLRHTEDPNLDTPLSPPPKAAKVTAGGRRGISSSVFVPNQMVFQQLKEMGFPVCDYLGGFWRPCSGSSPPQPAFPASSCLYQPDMCVCRSTVCREVCQTVSGRRGRRGRRVRDLPRSMAFRFPR
jgi:hypothetical protein